MRKRLQICILIKVVPQILKLNRMERYALSGRHKVSEKWALHTVQALRVRQFGHSM